MRKERLFIPYIVVEGALTKPRLRGGMASGPAAQFQDQFLEQAVIHTGAEICGTAQECRVLPGILFLQIILQYLRGDDPALCGFDLPKARIQIDIAEIIAQQKCKKAVHGRDLGIVQEDLLALQMRVGGVQGKTCGQGFSDPLPHLGGSGPGKCHNQQAVDVKGMLPLADQPDDPLDQNSLPAAADTSIL